MPDLIALGARPADTPHFIVVRFQYGRCVKEKTFPTAERSKSHTRHLLVIVHNRMRIAVANKRYGFNPYGHPFESPCLQPPYADAPPLTLPAPAYIPKKWRP